jgi:hypothetical protein
LSLIGDISFWRFYFRLFRGAIKSPQIAEFLKALQTHIGLKLLIIRQLASHRSRLVRDGHLKRHEAANFCPAEDCPDLCVIRLYFQPEDSIFNGSMLYRCCQSE